jgi:hypothetical protein
LSVANTDAVRIQVPAILESLITDGLVEHANSTYKLSAKGTTRVTEMSERPKTAAAGASAYYPGNGVHDAAERGALVSGEASVPQSFADLNSSPTKNLMSEGHQKFLDD